MKQVDVVGAVIRNHHGEILCALRSQQMSMPGLWEFPGGKVEPGEEPQASLRREIREELRCEIEVGGLIADAAHAYPEVLVRLLTFHATITAGEPVPAEHAELRWVCPADIAGLHWAPADLPTVARLLEPK